MNFREAKLSDIAQMQVVRHLVKENTLSDPNLVPDKDVAYYITEKGKGWVAELDGTLAGLQLLTCRTIVYGHYLLTLPMQKKEWEKNYIG